MDLANMILTILAVCFDEAKNGNNTTCDIQKVKP